MSKKFNFIASLEEDTANPKQKFQIFEIEMGFEKVRALVPFVNSTSFEDDAYRVQPKSISTLKKLVDKHGGTLE